MELLLYILIFIVGSAVGSFLGVVVDRSETGESVIKGRSHCDHCRHTLHWLDLIPIFSFLWLGGKCRYCHKKLSFSYPAIEATTGMLFVLSFFIVSSMFAPFAVGISQQGITLYYVTIFYYLLLVSLLIALFFIDLKYGILPFSIILTAGIITFLYILLTSSSVLLNSLLSAVGAFLFFLLIFFGTIFITQKEGMGFGDVVYAFLMGFILGFPKIVLGLYIAFVSGAVISLLLVALKLKRFKGGSVPFGPFLVFGTLVSLFWGEALIEKILIFLGV